MAEQTVRISNLPDSGSKHAVAFRLAQTIYSGEAGDLQRGEGPDRKYWLALYRECLRTVCEFS